jgi:hypothetical protein
MWRNWSPWNMLHINTHCLQYGKEKNVPAFLLRFVGRRGTMVIRKAGRRGGNSYGDKRQHILVRSLKSGNRWNQGRTSL